MEDFVRADLKPGEAALFGRAPDLSHFPPGTFIKPPLKIRILSELVSANHVLVVASDTGAWVLDLQSKNGTSVRQEPGVLYIEIAPRSTRETPRPAFPTKAVWTDDHDFARSVLTRVVNWLDDAGVDADAALLSSEAAPQDHSGLRLATGHYLTVTPRAGTHALRLVDDLGLIARFIEQQNALHAEEGDHEPGFVLRSESIREAHRAVCEAARRGHGLVLLGPSGTGKERFARCYHDHTPGSEERPFVTINCGAIPEALIENELFGSVPGAHAGAVNKPGLFESAHGGTLFLDEVGDMPLAVQVKLLRALENGTFRRLGDLRERRADVKVVCATNRDLRAAVEKGSFRADLWFRLAQCEVTLPPLRERPEDLDALLRVLKVSPAHSAWDVLSPEARMVLLHHPWPGNVRELCNFVRRLPDTPGTLVDVMACRKLLGLRAPDPPTNEAHSPAPPISPAADDWHVFEARVWSAWRRTHARPPRTFPELKCFIDDYLKPAFIAWQGGVKPDARTLEEVAVNAVATEVKIDWNTADKWLKRYFKTFGHTPT